MASLNKVMIIGFLGRDPETRFTTEGGLQITNITVATTRSYRNQTSGQMIEETEWHRIVFFGKSAETIQRYLKKGSQVYVEGRLRTRKWEKDGVTHYTTEIMGENFQFLDRKSDSAPGSFAPADEYASEVSSFASLNPRTAPQQHQQSFEKPVAPAQSRPYNQPTAAPSPEPFESEEDIPF